MPPSCRRFIDRPPPAVAGGSWSRPPRWATATCTPPRSLARSGAAVALAAPAPARPSRTGSRCNVWRAQNLMVASRSRRGRARPSCPPPQVVASVTMLSGVFVLALPITIISATFTEEFGALEDAKLRKREAKVCPRPPLSLSLSRTSASPNPTPSPPGPPPLLGDPSLPLILSFLAGAEGGQAAAGAGAGGAARGVQGWPHAAT